MVTQVPAAHYTQHVTTRYDEKCYNGAFFEARAIVMNERAAATRASAPSSGSTPHRGATAVRGGASEGDSGTAHLDKYEHAVREQPAREVRNV